MEERAKEIADLLRVLANEYRLLILCALIEEPLTVSNICQALNCEISQSAVSQHLALLKAHGILSSEKSAQSITYRITDERVLEVVGTLREQYC